LAERQNASYDKTTQDKVKNYHTYPSGTTVIKAFVASDFIFYDDKKHIVKILDKNSFQQVRLEKILGVFRRMTKTAKQLPFWRKLTGPRFAPFAAQCVWYYGLDVCISLMICPLGYIGQRK
jgi:hypothetical protein